MSTRIDELTIEITSSSDVATREIDKLASSLNSLKQSGKIGTVVKNITKLTNSLNALGNTNASKGILNLNRSLGLMATTSTKTGSAMDSLLSKTNLSIAGIIYGVKKIGSAIADWVTNTNDYIENVNLFQVSMGEYYDEAKAYAELVENKLGIDSSEWMKNQGTFMSMARGFGIVNEQAYIMSKGLTELAYDFSSIKNESPEEAFNKLRSAIAGEIEPMRAWGISLTQATLQEFALQQGITKRIDKMTEAEKAQLRYLAIVEKSADMGVIGDFARTLESPANALRVLGQQVSQLARALGSIFIPILIKVMPYVQAFVRVLTEAARAIALLFGFEMPEWESTSWGAGGIYDTADALDDATASAKKLKSVQMGFDELNVIEPNQNTGSGGAIGGGGGLNFDLQEVWDESLISSINSEVDGIIEKFKLFGSTVKDVFVSNKELIIDFVKVVGSIAIGISGGLAVWGALSTLSMGIGKGFGVIKSALESVYLYWLIFLDGVKVGASALLSSLAPITLIILAVASVVYTLWENWNLVVGVIQDFIGNIDLKGKFEGIMSALTPLLEKVGNLKYLLSFVGTVILTILQPAIAVIMGAFTGLINTIQPLITVVGGVIDIVSALGQFLVGVFTGNLELTQNSVELFKRGIVNIFTGLFKVVINLVVGFFEGFVGWFTSLHKVVCGDILVKFVKSFTTDFSNMFFKVMGYVDSFVEKFMTSLKNLWSNVGSWWKTNVAPKLTVDFWMSKFDGLKQGFTRVIKNMLNSGIELLNKFINWINSKLRFSWDGLTIMGKEIYPSGSVQLVKIPQITQRFEDGGFIEDGLFTMNKGEIAGKFNNGKSVVANNEQIIEGISAGVYAAFTKALSENSSNNNTYHFYLDGKEIRANIKKNEADSGLSLFGSELGYGY